jgi:UDPglucose 6-dehydrogenase
VAAALGGNLRGKTVAVLGLTFKPNTDDIREAPSIPLITALQDYGARVRVYDPAGMGRAQSVLENVEFCTNAYECAADAHAVVIVTEWDQFRALDLKRLAGIMACPVIIDLRNVYSPDEVIRSGFFYSGVGRAVSLSY